MVKIFASLIPMDSTWLSNKLSSKATKQPSTLIIAYFLISKLLKNISRFRHLKNRLHFQAN